MADHIAIDYVVVISSKKDTHRFAYSSETKAREAIEYHKSQGLWRDAILFKRTIVGSENPLGFSFYQDEPTVAWDPEQLEQIDI